MRRFYVISNKYKDPDRENANYVAELLRQLGAECECQEYSDEKTGNYRYTNPDLIPQDIDCIIVLGGDGTLLQAAIDLNGLNIPLFGVNIGTLGFLTDTDMSGVKEALTSVVNGNYEIDCRMMIDGKVYRDDEVIYENTSLNDIVINRCGSLRVIDFDVIVNDEYLSSYSADGVIVSTATGSTAYSLSAGGPILQPNAQLIMVTPICPHSLNKRSIIFGADDVITITMNDDKRSIEERVASFDGDQFFNVITGDKIVISRSDKVSKFVKTNKASFLQRVRQKMM
ncbi:MAG: NAD(+)/NADH kinase [Lachnospira sp.]|nr:NAD(+)/NADH kinase [Lachnospira sp.]